MPSAIEWTEETWNPIVGCSKTLTKPLHWRKPRKVFVCSMADLFHESVPFHWIDEVFAMAVLCPRHTFQILTKRPARLLEYLESRVSDNGIPMDMVGHAAEALCGWDSDLYYLCDIHPWPLLNVWIGVTCENQARAEERIPILLQCPAAVRFVSVEPMLGPVDLTKVAFQSTGATENVLKCDVSDVARRAGIDKLNGIDWVICGGESGPNARPMHPDWPRALRDQCVEADVPFLFKQWGEWLPALPPPVSVSEVGKMGSFMPDGSFSTTHLHVSCQKMVRIGKKESGRVLDGETWDQYPKGVEV